METPHTDHAQTANAHGTLSVRSARLGLAPKKSERLGVLAILCFRPRRLRSGPLCNWQITPARLSAWIWKLKKVLEMKSRSNEKITTGNNGEQSCRKGIDVAFRQIMELAHNICSMIVEKNRNLKDNIKDLERSAHFMENGSFLVRKYYFIGPAYESWLHDC